jgi:hypothetical protein
VTNNPGGYRALRAEAPPTCILKAVSSVAYKKAIWIELFATAVAPDRERPDLMTIGTVSVH